MRGKRAVFAAMCLGILCMLSACSHAPSEGEGYIYYINAENDNLQKEAYDLKGKTGRDAVEDLLKSLSETSEDEEYLAPVSGKIRVQDFTLDGGNLLIDFNPALKELKPEDGVLMRAAIVQTLLQVEEVEWVAFTVEGKPLLDSAGREIGFLNEDSFVQNTGSKLNSYQAASLKLYFADADGEKLVEEMKDVKYSSNISVEKLIVEQLVKGPSKNNHYPLLNPDTKILGVSIKDGICYVNFDEEFLISAYDVKPEITIYAVVDSLIAGTDASQVQISVNGEVDVMYMETIDLKQSFGRDESWIKGADK